MKPDSTPVTVIIPVFRNLTATRRCIESVLASPVGPRTSLIVIDDASPEPEISAWCEQLADRDAVTVLRNTRNLGFVATVNRGIEASGDTDVLLLNSDTEVANDWLQRLQDCAYSRGNIGTATPLSNNASVCSYPLPLRENPLPAGWSLQALDSLAAEANRGKLIELPTAVGFCMYIRRDCLDAVGVFDEENFGIGYGEECDFSMRARSANWINALCPGVFVYHEGGQSFTGQTDDRIRAAEETLHRLHPQYHVLATAFIDSDPIRPFRDALDQARIAHSPGDAPSVVATLKSHRDALVDSRSNRELALEHAFGELKSERELIFGRLEEALQNTADLQGKLDEVQAELGSKSGQLEATISELGLTAQELTRLQHRDWRWKYLVYFINRLDAVYMKFTSASNRT